MKYKSGYSYLHDAASADLGKDFLDMQQTIDILLDHRQLGLK